VNLRQVRLQLGSGFEFSLGASLVPLPQRKGAKREMVAGAVLVLFAQAQDQRSSFRRSGGRRRGIGQKNQSPRVSRMLFQHFDGGFVRREEIPTRKTALGEIDLHLGIVSGATSAAFLSNG
jgi:hypothetical protein